MEEFRAFIVAFEQLPILSFEFHNRASSDILLMELVMIDGSIVGGIILGCRYCDNSFEDATITSDDSGDIKTLNIFNIAVLV